MGDKRALSVLDHIERYSSKEIQSFYSASQKGFLGHYHRSPRYWIRAMDFEQHFRSATQSRSIHHFKDLHFIQEAEGKAICAIINSSLFFFWFMAICNGRNLTATDVGRFPVGSFEPNVLGQLVPIFDSLMENYKENSFIRERADCEYQEFRPSMSKPMIDRIDQILAEHYDFTEDELDFIVNYETKYRIGLDSSCNGE